VAETITVDRAHDPYLRQVDRTLLVPDRSAQRTKAGKSALLVAEATGDEQPRVIWALEDTP